MWLVITAFWKAVGKAGCVKLSIVCRLSNPLCLHQENMSVP